MKRCQVEGCTNKHYGHGYCEKHYKQIKRCGKILDRTTRTPNEIIEYEDYAEMLLYNNKNEVVASTKIDLDDIDKINKYKWCIQAGRGYSYIMNSKLGQLHRFLMNCPSDMQVDHINHDTFDNRKENLRICTLQENSWNSKIQTNNSSGYTGVKQKGDNWEAQIVINKRTIKLGIFPTKEEAIEARKYAEIEHYGDYAPENDNEVK